jgi:acetylornithine deacetylase/succinyl-diaminopimelate desuccinylase-like protein
MARALDEAGLDQVPFPTVDGLVLQGATRAEQAVRVAWLGSVAVVGADGAAVARALTDDPPYGARVTWESEQSADGWAAPAIAPWLAAALDHSSMAAFGQPSAQVGEGGTIPFLGWLAARFPSAQILALGVLVPGSNHHGPDESLHLPTAERVTGAVAALLVEHARQAAS